MLFYLAHKLHRFTVLFFFWLVAVYAVHAADWRYVFPGMVLDIAASDSGYYVLCDNRIVYALNADGNTLWQKSILFKPAGLIQYNSAGFLLVPFENGYIYGLSEAGRELFVIQDAGSDFKMYMLPKGLFLLEKNEQLILYNQFGKKLADITPADFNSIRFVYKNGTIAYSASDNETAFVNIFGYGITNDFKANYDPFFRDGESLLNSRNSLLAFDKDVFFYKEGDAYVLEDSKGGTRSYASLEYSPVAYALGNAHLIVAYENWLIEGKDFSKLNGRRFTTLRGDRSNGNVFFTPVEQRNTQHDRKYELLMTMAKSRDESVKAELLSLLFDKYEDGSLETVIPYLNDILQYLVLEFIGSANPNVPDRALNMPDIRRKAWRFAEYTGFGIGKSAFANAVRYEHDDQVLYSMAIAAAVVLTYDDAVDLYGLLLRRKSDSEIVLYGILKGASYLYETKGSMPDFIIQKASKIISGTYSKALQEQAFDLLKM